MGDELEIDKSHPLKPHLVNLVEQKIIEEI
jgi:hypothetical protein